jgi:hypothetical protein
MSIWQDVNNIIQIYPKPQVLIYDNLELHFTQIKK